SYLTESFFIKQVYNTHFKERIKISMSLSKALIALCLSTVIGLSACGEQKTNTANSNTAAGLMNTETASASDTKVISKKKSKKSTEAPAYTGEPVDINSATAEELVIALKGTGVGEAKVKKIIEYREEHNGFKSVDELSAVKGIGEKTVEKLRNRVKIGAGTPLKK
ncbi:ComEA family DNA-binding protein, partial [Kingella negevensis]|uniref:ComEA family DNA-binding protein n=2 Tax=Kingella negevensis TaxID=1522312 RepID=UPI00254C6803